MNKCNVCGITQKQIFSYQKYKYYRCDKCGLVTTLPYPSDESIKKHYANKFKKGNYELLLKYEKEYRRVYTDFITALDKIRGNSKRSTKGLRALDIGCFTGSFLLMLKKRGYDVTGIELQKEAVQLARKKLQKKVFALDVIKDKLPSGKYDLISMLGLIEHVKDPNLLIKKCASLLRKEGLVLIQTPNSGSIPARILRRYWPPYSPVEHIHLFSKDALTKLLEKNGFEVIYEKAHIKKLPFAYVYNMLDNFGPEFKNILAPIYNILPQRIKKLPLPFYIGEMIIIATNHQKAEEEF